MIGWIRSAILAGFVLALGGVSGVVLSWAQTYPASQAAGNPIPLGSAPITASATGTTAATTATLAAPGNGQRTYICGFSILANATAAATGEATVSGVVGGTMTWKQFTAPLASGIGNTSATFTPCMPSASINGAIAVASAAAGSGGVVSVNVWGYYY